MKSILKIVVALVILVASVNAARAAFNDYQFKDRVHEGIMFDPRATDAAVIEMVVRAAAEYQIPLDQKDVTVTLVGQERKVEMSYTSKVVLVPGVYARDWTFKNAVSTRVLAGVGR